MSLEASQDNIQVALDKLQHIDFVTVLLIALTLIFSSQRDKLYVTYSSVKR